MSDNPYPAPAPGTLALMCATHAWEDAVDDHSRKLLEWSHETIMALMDRLTTQAVILERLEARNDA